MALKEKKNVKIILCALVLVIIVLALFIKFALDKKEVKSDEPVKHTVVEKLYEDNSNEKCTEVIHITKNTDVSGADDKVLLNLIFGQLKKDKVLSNDTDYDDYKKSALKVLDESEIPSNFDYTYEGYKYSLKDENITRSKASCDKNYVSKLYGYSGTDKLELDVMAGYVKDDKVYDLNDKELGDYSEDDLNNLLDKGTMQVYHYEKVNDNYKLVSVGIK